MKIIYFISTVGHGLGGHFHSLNTIASEMSKSNEVIVVNIGVKPSSVFSDCQFDYRFIEFKGFNFLQTLLKLKKIVKIENPDILHAFDLEAFSFVRILSLLYKKVNFLNKCGGPNPKRYFPHCSNLILFSKENFNFFINSSNFKNTKLFLIPNRVNEVRIDFSRIESFKLKYKIANINLLRISRIGRHYESSILQSINLLVWLKSQDIEVKLIIIGAIQDQTIYEKLVEYAKNNDVEQEIIFETSEEFTNNARELLTLGDMVIGTGRNFMEASSLDIKLLVPSIEGNYPIIVTNTNFDQVFLTNFSPRTLIKGFGENQNLSEIKEVLLRKSNFSSKKWFDEYFSSDKVLEKYSNAYLNSNKFNFRLTSKGLLVNIIYSIRTFI